MDWIAQCRQQVAEALTRLTTKGLVQPPGAGFSVRIPGQAAMASGTVVRASRPLSLEHPNAPVPAGSASARRRKLDAPTTAGETPAPPAPPVSAIATSAPPVNIVAFDQAAGLLQVEEASFLRMHAAIYRHRPDVGAILTSSLPWCSWLAPRVKIPAVFDEQVRYLGPQVERLPLVGTELTPGAIAILKRGANAFLVGQETVCLGLTSERAELNAELLEKCAQAYILASLTRLPVGTIPFYVRFVASRRLGRDEKHAAEAYARGEAPFQPKSTW
jgi:ribulose-5-phosphate 4-epimerase/fuculose-1-phosphate aldolase